MDGLDEIVIVWLTPAEGEKGNLVFIEIDFTAHQSVRPDMTD